MIIDVDLSLVEFQYRYKQQIQYLEKISNLHSFQMVKIQIKNLKNDNKINYKNITLMYRNFSH